MKTGMRFQDLVSVIRPAPTALKGRAVMWKRQGKALSAPNGAWTRLMVDSRHKTTNAGRHKKRSHVRLFVLRPEAHRLAASTVMSRD